MFEKLVKLLEKIDAQYQNPECHEMAIRHILAYLNRLLTVKAAKVERLEDLEGNEVVQFHFESENYDHLLATLTENLAILKGKRFTKFNAAEIFEQNYLAFLDKNVVKPKKSSSIDTKPFGENKPLDEEKISSEKRRLEINNFLIRIKDAYGKDQKAQEQETALATIFNEAKLQLGQPLGEAYQASEGKYSIKPIDLIREACCRQQSNIVILFGEAQFDFNVKANHTFSLIDCTIITKNHDLLNILIDFGTNLDRFSPEYGDTTRNQTISFDMQHHLASLGCIVTDNQYKQLPRVPQQVYNAGQQFGSEYRNTINSSLKNIFPPTQISMIVIDYLGKSFSIPEQTFDIIQKKFVIAEEQSPFTTDHSKFFRAKEEKREASEIGQVTQHFERWIRKNMRTSEDLYTTHHTDLLRWLRNTGLVQSYQKFCKLALSLSQKGYNLNPPPSQEDFNHAIQTFCDRSVLA